MRGGSLPRRDCVTTADTAAIGLPATTLAGCGPTDTVFTQPAEEETNRRRLARRRAWNHARH